MPYHIILDYITRGAEGGEAGMPPRALKRELEYRTSEPQTPTRASDNLFRQM